MAKVYKRTDRKLIPDRATITESRRPLPAGSAVADGVASWTDRDGCERTDAIIGRRIQSVTATWTDSTGTKSATVDHTRSEILVAADNYTADFTVGIRCVRKSTHVPGKATALRLANQ